MSGDWGDCCGRVAARVLPGVFRASLCTHPLVVWLVCRVFKRRMMNTQHRSRVRKCGAAKTDVEQGIM